MKESIKTKIAAIIVTYNRLNLLKRCVTAVLNQSIQPDSIIIIDNASTDGTYEFFTQELVLPVIKYIRCKENGGGAKGFYEGIKFAHESDLFDAYWVMDDDGVPDRDCLENLLPYLCKYDYVAPLVLNIDNNNELAFNYGGYYDKKIIELSSENGVVMDYSCPFNGILYSKKLVTIIGYPKKEMFIWGDETNYYLRAKEKGFVPYTIMKAKHYHPKEKTQMYKSLKGNVVYVDNELKTYCYHRNNIYNYKNKMSIKSYIKYIIDYSFYYLIIKHKMKLFFAFINGFKAGIAENFEGHLKYLQNNN